MSTPVSNLLKINAIQTELGNIPDTVTNTRQMNEEKKHGLEEKLQAIDIKLNNLYANNKSGIVQSNRIKNLQPTLQFNKVNLTQKIAALHFK